MKYLKKYNENNSNELMKFLKKFNESELQMEYDLKLFCTEYLTELYDIGFDVIVTPSNNGIHTVWLGRRGKLFTWEDVKDIYIPFTEMLDAKFNIRLFKLHYGSSNVPTTHYKHDIIDDNIIEDDTLTYIVAYVIFGYRYDF